MRCIVWVGRVAGGVQRSKRRGDGKGGIGRFRSVAVINVEVGIYVHVDVQCKRMSHITTVTPLLVIRVVASDDVRVITVVTGGGIVVFTRDPN